MRFTSSIVIVTLALAACANAVSVPRAAPQMTAQEIQAVTQALELTLIKNLTAIVSTVFITMNIRCPKLTV